MLCCKFAGIANRMEHCGPSKAHEVLYDFIRTGQREQEAKEALTRFEGLYAYLKLIADRHGLDPFDHDVVEAYWIGNGLLDGFTSWDFRTFLPALGKRGLPMSIVRRLQEMVPEGALPHHAFDTLFVGVGQLTGKVEMTLDNMRNCLVSWGRVDMVIGNKIRVTGPMLGRFAGRYIMTFDAPRHISRPSGLRPDIGDMVAVHWGECVHILDEKQRENLETYTRRVIDSVNPWPSNP